MGAPKFHVPAGYDGVQEVWTLMCFLKSFGPCSCKTLHTYLSQCANTTMEAYLLTSGSAGVALLVNSMFWKIREYLRPRVVQPRSAALTLPLFATPHPGPLADMMAAWRRQLLNKSDAEASAIKASPKYLTDHSAQLNEAEWSAPLLAATLYLAVKGVPAPIASTLAVVGSIIYPVSRIHLGEIMPKITAIGAMGRLIGMGMLTYAVCKTLKK